MPLREYKDREGTKWRVWDITPDSLHESARSGAYLQGFVDGWLVFENEDATEKRRLYPVPRGWEEEDSEELERLRESAEPVRAKNQRRISGPTSKSSVATGAGRTAMNPPTRTFEYPGGRLWTVTEVPVPGRNADGSPSSMPTVVLRFTSGSRSLDLDVWPHWWVDMDTTELSTLLWRAFPRPPGGQNPTHHRRRRSDQVQGRQGERGH
jgi:hypothetical protein